MQSRMDSAVKEMVVAGYPENVEEDLYVGLGLDPGNRYPLLYWACRVGLFELVQALHTQRGADLKRTFGEEGGFLELTCAGYGLQDNRIKILEYLQEAGEFEIRDGGRQVFINCIAGGLCLVIKTLVETLGLDPNDEDLLFEFNCLHYACVNCHTDIVEYFVEQCGMSVLEQVEGRDAHAFTLLTSPSEKQTELLAYLEERAEIERDARR